MRCIAPMKAAKISYIVMSALSCLLGGVLFVMPEISVLWLGRLLGIGMILFGIVKLVGYFSRDLFRLAFQYDLAFGVLLIALGMVALLSPNEAMSFLCVLLGITILADGLFKVQMSVDSKRFGLHRRLLVLLLAVLTCAIGVILIFRPGAGAAALTMLLGLSLFLDGVLNLCVAICTIKIVAHQQPDVIEVEHEDVSNE